MSPVPVIVWKSRSAAEWGCEEQLMVRIVYSSPGPGPWNVITVAVRLAARLLEAELVEVPSRASRQKLRRVMSHVPERRGSEPLLVIAPEPVDLYAAVQPDLWLRGFHPLAAWVVDSWWEDRIPSCAKRGLFDIIYVSEKESVEPWRRATRADVRWLPQGTNVLEWGVGGGARPVALQRVGRQPKEWSDDQSTAKALGLAGLTFRGSPPFVEPAEMAMAQLLAAFGQARFSLAFTNRVDPQPYTHPTREYMTGRWTDSLASGAVVAGVPPDTESVRELLWPGALLDLGTTDRRTGIELLRAADERWSPDVAAMNHLNALRRLDWRWRVAQLAADLELETPSLTADLSRLQVRIAELEASGSKKSEV